MNAMRALAAVAMIGLGWAGEPKKEAVTEEQLREALKGFKGFLAGDVVKREKAGAILFIRSITLVEGNQAKGAGTALGQEVPVQYATEKDEKGVERPKKALSNLMQNLEKFPAFLLGGPMGGNVMIAMDGAVAAGGAAQVQGITVQGGAVKLEVNGAQIELGGDDAAGKEKAEKPRGPAATLRVQASEDGTLVADRAVPGMQPAATWGGMPNVQLGGIPGLEEPQAPPKKEGGKDAQF
ncbi:MAG: hypothetical protein FJ291_25805 [Planctomycetes bacterium]|nr:hypothetical protein [Planctomycetota bacterium]